MSKPTKTFSYDDTLGFLENLTNSDFSLFFEKAKKQIIAEDAQNEKIFTFRLPLPYPSIAEEDTMDSYLEKVSLTIPDYVLILLQAGIGVIGTFEEGQIENHKVIRKYMVRAKQGKAQIQHLKTKGKSRLGSRIRLTQTKDFFEELNEKLQDWEIESTDYIFYSASINLWNLVFESKVSPPFERKDNRLIKIPEYVNYPNYEALQQINQEILKGKLFLHQEIRLGHFF